MTDDADTAARIRAELGDVRTTSFGSLTSDVSKLPTEFTIVSDTVVLLKGPVVDAMAKVVAIRVSRSARKHHCSPLDWHGDGGEGTDRDD